jgi:pimeloyl-ACP methyl ester carboxylesterase
MLRVISLLAAGLLGAVSPAIGPGPLAQPADQPVRLETSTGTVHGSLLLPATAGPHPVILLHAGSGPTDRNGNSALIPGSNNGLKLLAEALAARGVASVRYDKRGVAASAAAAPRESDLRFDTYVDDAAGWIRLLRADSRFSTITVAGHSEGSLIGMLAAERARADAFVSVAGLARRASDVLRDQLRPRLPADLWQESERILAALEAGRTTDDVPSALGSLYRSSVQPYLISWFRYLPADELKRVPGSVLIVQGTTDVQVRTAEAEALKQARPDAELLIIEGMNHVLKLVPSIPAQQTASYSDPSLPVAPLLVERTHRFVASVRRLP